MQAKKATSIQIECAKRLKKSKKLVAGNYSAAEPSPEDLFVREKPSSDIQNPNLLFLITKPRKPRNTETQFDSENLLKWVPNKKKEKPKCHNLILKSRSYSPSVSPSASVEDPILLTPK
jgi:hypothetical protein